MAALLQSNNAVDFNIIFFMIQQIKFEIGHINVRLIPVPTPAM